MSHKNFTSVSIIIPTRNRLGYLVKCLASIEPVINFSEINYEVIVYDGGSEDGTVSFLENCHFPWLKWFSEPDKGAVFALNKAIRLSTGNIIRYFSDDDEMFPENQDVLIETLLREPYLMAVGGTGIYYNVRDGNTKKLSTFNLLGDITRYRFAREQGLITHEAMAFRRELFEKYGLYDEKIQHSFDVELWWRIVDNGLGFRILDLPLTRRHLQPTSNSQNNDMVIFWEFVRIYFKYRAFFKLYEFLIVHVLQRYRHIRGSIQHLW